MILIEAECSKSVSLVGLTRAMPPSLVGNASKSRSESFGGGLPVIAGKSSVLITSSSGWSR